MNARGLLGPLLVAALVAGVAIAGASEAGPVAQTLVVTSTSDPGDGMCLPAQCTLREALNAANPGDRIEFDIPSGQCSASGPCTIFVAAGLPAVPGSVAVDATSQPGYSNDPLIIIDGIATASANGLSAGGPGVTLRALQIRNFGLAGISGQGAGLTVQDSVITANLHAGIQLSAPGALIERNHLVANMAQGIHAQQGVSDLTIRSNTIEGNALEGIAISGANNSITANLITGNGVTRGASGVHAYFGAEANAGLTLVNNSVFGNGLHGADLAADEGLIMDNHFAGNSVDGVEGSLALRATGSGLQVIHNAFTNNLGGGAGVFVAGDPALVNANTMLQNAGAGIIGRGNIDYDFNLVTAGDAAGIIASAEGGSFTRNVITSNNGHGIHLRGVTAVEPVMIGGSTEAANTILNNGGSAVFLDDGDIFASGQSLEVPRRVTISRNVTYLNGFLAIDLAPEGVNENDDGDTDDGPNGLLNFPVLESADAHALSGTACAGCRIELFIAGEGGNPGQGAAFVAEVVTATGELTIPLCGTGVQAGDDLTATATDELGNTSEFSRNLTATEDAAPECEATPTPAGTPTPTPTTTPAPSPTATPQPVFLQGDIQCDGDVDTVDALQQLRHVAALTTFQQDGCPEIGAAGGIFGDVDCDGDVDSVDALKVLRHVAALSVTQTEPCTDIGDPL